MTCSQQAPSGISGFGTNWSTTTESGTLDHGMLLRCRQKICVEEHKFLGSAVSSKDVTKPKPHARNSSPSANPFHLSKGRRETSAAMETWSYFVSEGRRNPIDYGR